MVIIIYFASILLLAVLIGEIRFRQLKLIKKSTDNFLNKEWSENVDKDMNTLNIETPMPDMVSMETLAMRGSWRLAQKLNMDMSDFEELAEIEYRKSL